MPSTQSVYRQFHSTETAIMKVYNDLLLAADEGQVSALCLLDLMAANRYRRPLSAAAPFGAPLWSSRLCGFAHICQTGHFE